MARKEAAFARDSAAVETRRAALGEKKAALARNEVERATTTPVLPSGAEQKLADLKAQETERRLVLTLGDVLFAVANLGRWMKTHPEEALRGTLRRFESRFHHIENSLAGRGKSPRDSTLAEMDTLWEEAKRREASAD